jgi:CheY-like chemotaxis protein
MPEMNGFDLIFELKSEPATARLPIIVLTGMELSDDDVESLRGGASAILLKGSSWRARLLGELRKVAG